MMLTLLHLSLSLLLELELGPNCLESALQLLRCLIELSIFQSRYIHLEYVYFLKNIIQTCM